MFCFLYMTHIPPKKRKKLAIFLKILLGFSVNIFKRFFDKVCIFAKKFGHKEIFWILEKSESKVVSDHGHPRPKGKEIHKGKNTKLGVRQQFDLFCSTTALLRPVYHLSTSTSLLRLAYFDLLSNLDFLVAEKYSFGRSKVVVELQKRSN